MLPSTVRKASFPKWALFTLEGLRRVSFRLAPERALSKRCVKTSTCELAKGTAKTAVHAANRQLLIRVMGEPNVRTRAAAARHPAGAPSCAGRAYRRGAAPGSAGSGR